MEKEFVPYEQALALKELGFDEPCFGYYTSPDNLTLEQPAGRNGGFVYFAPTFSQAFRWFREKYNLHSTLHLNSKGYFTTITEKINNLTPCIFSSEIFNEPEEAELECLKKLIEIVKKKIIWKIFLKT